MLPPATAGALAVACRTVFELLESAEAADLRAVDLEKLIRRFENKRARDFNPSSLKEYGRRVRRAWALFSEWKESPADFAPKTRAAAVKKAEGRATRRGAEGAPAASPSAVVPMPAVNLTATSPALDVEGVYSTAFPVRRGHVVTISNLPADLTVEEAERLSTFLRLMASDA
jgi:hypothetical protein